MQTQDYPSIFVVEDNSIYNMLIVTHSKNQRKGIQVQYSFFYRELIVLKLQLIPSNMEHTTI